METRTREELESLKREWRSLPCWDIESTDGFEAHVEELTAYRLECEAQWERKLDEEHLAIAASVGCPGNSELGAYIKILEMKLERLSREIIELKYRDE